MYFESGATIERRGNVAYSGLIVTFISNQKEIYLPKKKITDDQNFS